MICRHAIIAVSAGFLLSLRGTEAPKSAVSAATHPEPPPVLPSSRLKAAAIPLDRLLVRNVWAWSVQDFSAAFPAESFAWVTEKQDRAVFLRVPKKGQRVDLRLGDRLKPVQATVDFREGRPRRIELLIYTRGDAGSLTKTAFGDLTLETLSVMEGIFGPPDADSPSSGARKAVKVRVTRWQTEVGKATLETGAETTGDFRAEFVRVVFTPPGGAAKPPRVVRTDLTDHVRRDSASGDVWIDAVPMVDQGTKGYCVLASCQRLFEYYGISVDQHELAQITGASRHGTNLLKMQEALQKIDGRMQVRVRLLIAPLSKQDDYFRLMQDYNQAARRTGKPELDYRKVTYDIATLDPPSLREAKLKGPGFDKFVRMVRESTEKGIPLLWALELGMYPESGASRAIEATSHVRLIIGFNLRTRELLFSDTWGRGHECKRMAAADAFAATMGLYLMEPLARRAAATP
ncbi:MAG: hypothetical protein KA004_01505 [Verrucomicrobiales bacterium]|nr:hypothetical protein [Verrucomicrobiales bacterium]